MLSNQPLDDSKSDGGGSERSSVNLGGGGGDPQKKALKKPVKSVIPKLQNCSVNLSLFRKVAADELRELIEEVQVPNPHKAFVFDPELISSLSLIVPYSFFIPKGTGASEPEIGVLKQEKIQFKTVVGSVFYITRPRMDLLKIMSSQINHIVSGSGSSHNPVPNIYVVFVPRRTLICEVMLEKMNILQHIQKPLLEFSLDFIPFDNDLLSMELPNAFREFEIDGDYSALYSVARSVMKLQSVYGVIPNIKYVGKSAKMAFEILQDLKHKSENVLNQVNPSIGNLIFLDRRVDLVSPLVTPLTYEGLLDLFYKIQNNLVTIPFLSQPVTKKEDGDKNEKEQEVRRVPTRLPLNDDDEVFKQIRHLNFLGVGAKLQSITEEIDKIYEEKKNLVSLEDIKAYFQQLPEVQQKHKDLTTHITIATEIKKETSKQEFRRRIRTEQDILLGEDPKACIEYIETCIIRQDSLTSVLRLICLYSIVRNGLSQSEYDHLRQELIHSYGHFVVLSLKNLEEAGLLKKSASKINWSTTPFGIMKKGLNLVAQDQIDETSQKNMAYVHSGYAPMSCRIIQESLTNSKWENLKYLFKGSEHVEFIGESMTPTMLSSDVTVVVFLGGCTLAEISALRSLSNHRFIILTTKIINSDNFISSMLEKL